MRVLNEIDGMEFDWFAIDSVGQFALLATAGEGFVPESVLSSLTRHQEIAECFQTEGWGSEAVWDSYAKAGLFVYDWSLSDEMYVLKASPTTQISANLLEQLRNLAQIPQMNKRFKDSERISSNEFM
jgi:hypothetical protein